MSEQSSPIRDLMSSSQPKYDLSYILEQAKPEAPFAARCLFFQLFMGWLRPTQRDRDNASPDLEPGLRLKFLLQFLRRHPESQKAFSAVLTRTFGQGSAFSFFAYAGLPELKSFSDQLVQLSIDAILPVPPREEDLESLLRHLFVAANDARWLESLPEDTLKDFMSLWNLTDPHSMQTWNKFRRDLLDALLVLANQIAAIALSPSFWQRSQRPPLAGSPALKLMQRTEQLRTQLLELIDLEPFHLIPLNLALGELADVEQQLIKTFAYVEQHGINLGLVYRMEYQAQLIERYRDLCECLQQMANGRSLRGGQVILSKLVAQLYSTQNLQELWSENGRRLARRMIEHAGQSGEHYITRNSAEYKGMLLSAAGGGVLTVGTSLLKTTISQWKLPALTEAVLHASNYVGSFWTMQALHLTLATKQPSVTASHLAVLLAKGQGADKGLAIVEEIRLVIRSQIAAIAGNIGLAIPTALLISGIARGLGSQGLFSEATAQYTVHSFDPFTSLTLFYAALTGVLLWLSSLFAAWLENASDFYEIPTRLTAHPLLKSAFGETAGERWATFLRKHLSGVAGSLALGTLLACIPFLGKISGLPFDVRHVTLSSAQLSIALVSAWESLSLSEILRACLGIVCIGALNFGVSFSLALTVAIRAQNVNALIKGRVARRLVRLLRAEPLSFIWPRNPKGTEP